MNTDALTNANIRRSCSSRDVTENHEENPIKPPPIKIGISAIQQVNSAPQDFVIVKSGNCAGQNMISAYKVSKSNASQSMLSPRPPMQPADYGLDPFDVVKLRADLSNKSKEELLEECVECRRMLHRQELDIMKLRRRLTESSNPLTTSQSATKSGARHKFPLTRVSPLLGSETDSPTGIHDDSPFESECGMDTLVSNSCSTVISPKNVDELSKVGISECPSSDSPCDLADDCTIQTVQTIVSMMEGNGFGQNDSMTRTAPLSSALATDAGADSAFVRMSQSGPLKPVIIDISTSDEKVDSDATNTGSASLKRRLNMNASERRKTRIPVTQRLRNLPKHPPTFVANGVEGPPLPRNHMKSSRRFDWETEAGDQAHHGLLLFMIHDNHMLGATVAAAVQGLDSKGLVVAKRPAPLVSIAGMDNSATGGRISPGSVGGGGGMAVMLESKDDSGASLFVIGTIIYSGDMSNIKGADASNPRGAQCMVIAGVQAIRAKVKDFPTRSRPGNADIKELDMSGLPAECYAKVETSDDIRRFLQKCPSRVDVILDPSRSESNWFPYWEGDRKMAPQFRSRGVGYIRLGDDMSMNGTAFLSTDAGVTFLDDGSNSVLDAPKVSCNNPLGSPGGVLKFRQRSGSSFDVDPDGRTAPKAHTPGSPRRPGSTNGATATIKNILQSLHNADLPSTNTGSSPVCLTWSERVDLLKKFQKELRSLTNNLSTAYTPRTPDATSMISGEWVSEAFGIIADSLVKQKNPNVLKESLLCVPLFSPWIPSPLSSDLLPSNAPASATSNLMAWRNLFLEVVHCLRHANRNAGECAKAVLDELGEKRAITFLSISRLNPSPFQEILVGPVRGNSNRPVASSSSSISTAANTAKVMKWLAGVTSTASRESARAALSGGITDDDFYQGAQLLKTLKPLLFHREASTRDEAVALMAVLVSYDILSAKKSQAPGPKLTESPRGARSNSMKNLLAEAISASDNLKLLPEDTSLGTMQILREVDEESSKICARIVKEALELVKVIRSAPVEELIVPNPPISAIPAQRRTSRSSILTVQSDKSREPLIARTNSTIRFENAVTLDDEWYEVRLALKNPPSDEASWNQMIEIIDKSAGFFSHINAECAKHSVTSGELIRALLPFNESTSSGDQANVNSNFDNSSNIPAGIVSKYRPYAVSLRSLIRVKMADAEDLKQAKVVTEQLKSFCYKAQRAASDQSVSVVSLLHL